MSQAGSVDVPGFDSASPRQPENAGPRLMTPPGTMVIDLDVEPEPEPEPEPDAAEATPLAAILARRKKHRRGSAMEMAMIETPADAPEDQASADTPKVDGGVTWKLLNGNYSIAP